MFVFVQVSSVYEVARLCADQIFTRATDTSEDDALRQQLAAFEKCKFQVSHGLAPPIWHLLTDARDCRVPESLPALNPKFARLESLVVILSSSLSVDVHSAAWAQATSLTKAVFCDVHFQTGDASFPAFTQALRHLEMHVCSNCHEVNTASLATLVCSPMPSCTLPLTASSRAEDLVLDRCARLTHNGLTVSFPLSCRLRKLRITGCKEAQSCSRALAGALSGLVALDDLALDTCDGRVLDSMRGGVASRLTRLEFRECNPSSRGWALDMRQLPSLLCLRLDAFAAARLRGAPCRLTRLEYGCNTSRRAEEAFADFVAATSFSLREIALGPSLTATRPPGRYFETTCPCHSLRLLRQHGSRHADGWTQWINGFRTDELDVPLGQLPAIARTFAGASNYVVDVMRVDCSELHDAADESCRALLHDLTAAASVLPCLTSVQLRDAPPLSHTQEADLVRAVKTTCPRVAEVLVRYPTPVTVTL